MARAYVRTLLADWDVDPEVADTAELLVTELVTNAVIHARSRSTVSVTARDGAIEFTVSDRSRRPVQLRLPSVEAATGRGVYFLDQLASDWEVVPTAEGKKIWFRLPVDVPSTVSP